MRSLVPEMLDSDGGVRKTHFCPDRLRWKLSDTKITGMQVQVQVQEQEEEEDEEGGWKV